MLTGRALLVVVIRSDCADFKRTVGHATVRFLLLQFLFLQLRQAAGQEKKVEYVHQIRCLKCECVSLLNCSGVKFIKVAKVSKCNVDLLL